MTSVVVAHQPPDHPYVRHIGSSNPADGPCVWDLDTVSSSGASIVHLHFGFEHLDVVQLEGWLRDARRRRLGLVLTVHDLQNPHLVDQAPYRRLLSLLIDEADAVITLTPWAARMIDRQYRRRAVVIPHPHVVPLDELRRRRRPAEPRRGVYVHAATCRPNLDVELIAAFADSVGHACDVLVHVRSPLSSLARRVVARLDGAPGVRLDVGPRLSDPQLWARIERAAAVLLAYRWGTHSGLLEAAADLGTPCLAPPIGGHVDQGAVAVQRTDPGAALRQAAAVRPTWDDVSRAHQRSVIVDAHQQVYAEVLDRLRRAA